MNEKSKRWVLLALVWVLFVVVFYRVQTLLGPGLYAMVEIGDNWVFVMSDGSAMWADPNEDRFGEPYVPSR